MYKLNEKIISFLPPESIGPQAKNQLENLSSRRGDAPVWVVLHSGSRGIGNRLATKHIKVAQELMDHQSVKLIDEVTEKAKTSFTSITSCGK